jgi:fatty-acyl-CoA synthase
MTPELDWLKRWSLYSPNAVALQSGEDGSCITYAQLYRQSCAVAQHLRERFAIEPGDRVACLAQNELEYVALFFALQRLGAILVPINFRFTSAEVGHVVHDCGAKLLIAQQAFWSVAQSTNVNLWSFDGPESLVALVGHRIESREIPFTAEFEDPCMILYTSGTTGFPKGAVISHRMVYWNSINTGLRLNLTQNDVVLTFLPLFHTGGWNVLTTPCLHRGAKVVLLRKFDAGLVLNLCASEKVSVLFGVPTTMDLLQQNPIYASVDLRSIRYAIVGGEPMPVELIRLWEARGIPIRQGYGLTEFGPNVFSLNQGDSQRKMGSIGFPNFYIDARVVNDQGEDLPAGEVGELILRGPVAMSGYWQNPKATAETLRDGWLYTGDLVRRDSEGYFFVVGRKKEMFISGGENVYPAEVEKVLRGFSGVREAAVIGVPHPKWGESGRAFLSSTDGAELDRERLREHCAQLLAKFKIPQEFVFLPDLPKTESGKIAKKSLARLAL